MAAHTGRATPNRRRHSGRAPPRLDHGVTPSLAISQVAVHCRFPPPAEKSFIHILSLIHGAVLTASSWSKFSVKYTTHMYDIDIN